jgi:NADPH:quinone reductase-like Zn-dependent oxidoreductase
MPDDVPETMSALRLHARGGAGDMVLESAAVPTPGTGDVLIAVAAASFTPDELTWPSTWVDRSGHDRLPVVPCHEVSGTVAALGWGAAGLVVGDEVYGLTDWYRDGAAAGYVAVEARNLAHKPAGLSHTEAATLPLAGLTALQGLLIHGGLQAGQTVLINGAGGGVGTLAVQIARAHGARVLAAGRPSVADLVRRLGAHAFVDVTAAAPSDPEPVDVVLDLIGGASLERCWPAVREGGVVVSIAEPLSADRLARHNVRGVYFVVEPDRRGLDQLAEMVAAGRLAPVVGAVGALSEAAALLEEKQRGGTPGKVALTVAG